MGILGKSKREKELEEKSKREMQTFRRSKDGMIQCTKDATGIERCEVLPTEFVTGDEAIYRRIDGYKKGYSR